MMIDEMEQRGQIFDETSFFEEDEEDSPPTDCSLSPPPSDDTPPLFDDNFIDGDDNDEPSEPPPSESDHEIEDSLPFDDDDENCPNTIPLSQDLIQEQPISNQLQSLLELKSLSKKNSTLPFANDESPTTPILPPPLPSEAMVPIQDHPDYSKYLKMIKIGLPLPLIRDKVQKEGYDPQYLDCSPDTLIPLNKPTQIKTIMKKPIDLNEKKPLKQKRRTLHWKEINKEDLDPINVWTSTEEESEKFELETDELIKLFVLIPPKTSSSSALSANGIGKSSQSSSLINVLDSKRCRNACIALARIRVPFEEIRRRISLFDYQCFTPDQINILLEYLPTPSELSLLQAHRSTHPSLPLSAYQISNQYMLTLSSLPVISSYLHLMKYIHLSSTHLHTMHSSLTLFKSICSEFITNSNLKLFLQFILQIVNLINTIPLDEKRADLSLPSPPLLTTPHWTGFKLDSLLKLRTIKSNNLNFIVEKSINEKNENGVDVVSQREEEERKKACLDSTPPPLPPPPLPTRSRIGGGSGTISLLFYILQLLTIKQLNYFLFYHEIQFFQSHLSSSFHHYCVENLLIEYQEMKREYQEKREMFNEILRSEEAAAATATAGVEEEGGVGGAPGQGRIESSEVVNMKIPESSESEKHRNEMKKGRQHVEKYLLECDSQLQQLHGLLMSSQSSFQQLLRYFGEDSTMTSQEFFTIFTQFVEGVIIEKKLVDQAELSIQKQKDFENSLKKSSNDENPSRRKHSRRNSSYL